ncbi:hypothetical protein EIP91_002277 [Steccherinum ochraceum]|uniref:Uncharacterized protein n=1 Tax=Steccherinum ochraceum TaxID=92696 RepID=A0A4R0RCG9_9APHY|nr:hypothetical protein EIP91_002277 [Steccherinum ochraceum]
MAAQCNLDSSQPKHLHGASSDPVLDPTYSDDSIISNPALDKLNAGNIVAQLPEELVVEILLLLVQSCFVEGYRARRLYRWRKYTLLCRRWREIALDCPTLWRTIHVRSRTLFPAPVDPATIFPPTSSVMQLMRRSKIVPLHIMIHNTSMPQCLIPEAHRIYSLRLGVSGDMSITEFLRNCQDSWHPHNLDSIQVFNLDGPDNIEETILCHLRCSLPSLRNLHTSGYPCSGILPLLRPTLQSLRMTICRVDMNREFLHALGEMSSLDDLYLETIAPDEDDGSDDFPENAPQVNLRSLRTFQLAMHPQILDSFIRCLSIPSVTSMVLLLTPDIPRRSALGDDSDERDIVARNAVRSLFRMLQTAVIMKSCVLKTLRLQTDTVMMCRPGIPSIELSTEQDVPPFLCFGSTRGFTGGFLDAFCKGVPRATIRNVKELLLDEDQHDCHATLPSSLHGIEVLRYSTRSQFVWDLPRALWDDFDYLRELIIIDDNELKVLELIQLISMRRDFGNDRLKKFVLKTMVDPTDDDFRGCEMEVILLWDGDCDSKRSPVLRIQ